MRFAPNMSRQGVNSIFAVEFTGVGGLLSSAKAVFLPTNRYIVVFAASEKDSTNCCALWTLNLLVTMEGIFFPLLKFVR
jgi:hypothetical protein